MVLLMHNSVYTDAEAPANDTADTNLTAKNSLFKFNWNIGYQYNNINMLGISHRSNVCFEEGDLWGRLWPVV